MKSKKGSGKSKRSGAAASEAARATASGATGRPSASKQHKLDRTRSQAIQGHISARSRRQQAKRDSR